MGYVEGFLLAVPTANKDEYLRHAAFCAPLFKEFGVTRHVEAWGDAAPDGELNDLKGAVKATADEVVVFSWLEYPDRAARDAANEKIMSDPRMKEMGDVMPFDGMRMIFGGFASLVDEGPKGAMGYVDGVLVPAPAEAKDDYRRFAQDAAAVFLDHGATRVVDAWGDDVPDGKVTDFKGAVLAREGETVVYSWIEWPSKEVRDAGWPKVMGDPRLQDRKEPFDGKRMTFGGFTPILDV